MSEKRLLLTQIRQDLQSLCYDYDVIDKKSLKKHNNKLYDVPYIPRLLLYELDDIEYMEHLESNGLEDEYDKELLKLPHKMHRYNEIMELNDWVGKHKEYSNIIDENELKKLDKDIHNIYNVYDGFIQERLGEKISLEKLLEK